MIEHIVFIIGLIVSVVVGLAYFRDLGDVSQMFIRVERKYVIRFIRNEYRILAVGLGAAALMVLAYFLLDGGAGTSLLPMTQNTRASGHGTTIAVSPLHILISLVSPIKGISKGWRR